MFLINVSRFIANKFTQLADTNTEKRPNDMHTCGRPMGLSVATTACPASVIARTATMAPVLRHAISSWYLAASRNSPRSEAILASSAATVAAAAAMLERAHHSEARAVHKVHVNVLENGLRCNGPQVRARARERSYTRLAFLGAPAQPCPCRHARDAQRHRRRAPLTTKRRYKFDTG